MKGDRMGEIGDPNRQRLKNALTCIRGLIWEASLDPVQFTYISDNAEELTGFPNTKWLSAPHSWREHIYQEDQERVFAHIDQVIKNKNTVQFEYRFVGPHGELTWFKDLVTYVSRPGEDPFLQGIMVNIQQRKEAEEAEAKAQRTLIDERNIFVKGNAVVFKWRNEEGWPVEYVSPNVEQVFGYSVEEFLTGSVSYATIIHEHDLEKVAQEVVSASENGVTTFQHEVYRVTRQDGEVIWLHDHTNILRDNEGEITHYLGYVVDITAAKRAEEELRKLEKLESVGLLAGGIAHDFNNILTGLLGCLTLSLDEIPENASPHEELCLAKDAVLQAKNITQQLLTFAKGGDPVRSAASLEELVRETASFLLHGSSLSYSIQSEENLSRTSIDTGQVSQVLHNLIVNSIQAMPHGGKITIQLQNRILPTKNKERLPQGEYVAITLSDQGCGIPDEVLPKIFDPYFTTKPDGSGLGLATSHSIISKHNGLLSVSSTSSEGTTFTVLLPATSDEIVEAPLLESNNLSGTARVLVMDDEALICDLAKRSLEMHGYQVSLASSGEVAIACFSKAIEYGYPFDVVILDLTIRGGIGGLETLRELQKLDPQIKAIVSSGYSNDPVMANYADYGFSAVVTKPYSLLDLTRAVHDLTLNNVIKEIDSDQVIERINP